MTAKSSHLEGAAALLGARGVDRGNCLLGPQGLNLFLHFRSQLVIILQWLLTALTRRS
jgi:hypothetical protein